ncbi:CLUMA_CG020104, isoform A [Clunio marinus]|uniref:CLUMA_CG020104, isoform A n=1 Tax=Clunio marinus TaxID=568069 RepID=A0A1J1J3U4_9DIPT|nr:CLUMA_CG020104, isoform A [Clunio marinus]
MKCPGLYCGRMPLENNTFSECGACDRGWKRNEEHLCEPCYDNLVLYDWLFLAFAIIVPLLIHSFLIDYTTQQRKFSKEIIFLYLCAVAEVGISAILTVLLSEPMLSFKIYSCGVNSLSDWYTYFYNPTLRFEKTLTCTQERVYPLQTMVLVFYVLCVSFMLLFRPLMNEKCKPKIEKSSLAIYYALYAFPLLAIIHSIFGGLVYFAFPYLSIIISCAANAGHFAMKLDQSMKSLFITSIMDIRNIIIIVGNWILFSFGIISIKKLFLLFLTPVPSIFYIVTSKYTSPEIY